MPLSVLNNFGLDAGLSTLVAFGNGLINSTWKVEHPDGQFILQRINTAIFKKPQHIAANINSVAAWLTKHHPDYLFIAPIPAKNGGELIEHDGSFYRLFPFVHGSHSIDVVVNPAQAYEAAAQFGRFTTMLSGFNIADLYTTIPAFHDVEVRYKQFLLSLQSSSQQRITAARPLIKVLQDNCSIVDQYVAIKANTDFKLRVTHHDTKISNVLFNQHNKAICVIDLDTVMPGYFISDVGDMMRTYLSPVSEEESDFSKIVVRADFYKAIVAGYFSEMEYELTSIEKEHFYYAGKFMIFMQALRFITDYLNNDVYYGEKYPGQNLVRAGNQVVLLQRFLEMGLL